MTTHEKKDQPAHDAAACCPVCGAGDRKGCADLDKLGTRSLTADHLQICPVCGSDYTLLVWIRGFKMCGLCAENIDQALRILRHKHKSRLDQILLALDKLNHRQ